MHYCYLNRCNISKRLHEQEQGQSQAPAVCGICDCSYEAEFALWFCHGAEHGRHFSPHIIENKLQWNHSRSNYATPTLCVCVCAQNHTIIKHLKPCSRRMIFRVVESLGLSHYASLWLLFWVLRCSQFRTCRRQEHSHDAILSVSVIHSTYSSCRLLNLHGYRRRAYFQNDK